MMYFNKEKSSCTGCTACYAVCPKKCISMKADEEGFQYPESSDACVHCGLCEKVCPICHEISPNDFNNTVVAATSRDYSIWHRSASGGGFSGVCRSWGDEETLVVAAAWDGLRVHHIGVNGVDNIAPLCKSKYIASQVEDTFTDILNHLKTGKKAIFCGTPCQVAGLRSFLRKPYENLLLIDFICHGVGSPEVFKHAINAIAQQAEKKIVSYTFRHKAKRYEQDYVSEVTFVDGTTKRIDDDQYMQLFISRASHRPCCGDNCKFRNSNRPGDITLADARGMKTYITKHYDSTRNYTHIIANNNHGAAALDNIEKYMYIYNCSINDVIRFNPLFDHNVPHENKRDKFFKLFVESPQEAISKYTKPYRLHKLNLKRIIKLYSPKWLYNSIIYKFVG